MADRNTNRQERVPNFARNQIIASPTSSWKETFQKRFSALRNLPRFFALVWQANKTLTLANLLLRLIKSAIPLAVLYIGKEIIDEVVWILKQKPAAGFTDRLWILVGIELGLALVSDFLNRFIALFDSLLGDLLSNKTSVELVHHAARLDLYQFENPVFYDKLERARQQTFGRNVLLSQTFSQLQDIITVVLLAGGIISFNPWMLLLLAVAVIPSFMGETYFNERSYSLTRGWTPERRELDYYRYLGASLESAKEVKVFGLENYLVERFKRLSDKYYKANKEIVISRAWWGNLLAGIGTLCYYAAYIIILFQTLGGAITLGALTFLSGSFQRMHGMMQSIMSRFTGIAENALYLQDLFDFFEIKPTIPFNEGGIPMPTVIKEGFVFEHVSFRYPENENYTLSDIHFTLHPGEKIALVGENGAGKTTLVKLLARLYLPTEGRILVEGRDLSEYNLVDLRAHIGIIFQDFLKYEMTASENIAIGDINELGNEIKVHTAAEKSLALEMVNQLPDKFNQFLGKRLKKGQDLSGGQWQKIALARAYMRDSELIILDEPTAALDARAEHEVFLRFSQLIKGKMAVLISHRFSTVRMADRILFLDQGKIVEEGSHETLLELNGRYAELFRLQAKGYQ